MTTGSERRAERRRRVERRRRRRRIAKIVLLAAPFVIGAAVGAYILTRPDPRAGSERLPDGPVDVASRVLDAYRIVYRVEDAPSGAVSTERIVVRRPFESRMEVRSGPPPGVEELNVQVSTFARLGLGPTVLQTPPDIGSGDRRPDASLEHALGEGFAEERERRSVAGRVCRVVRAAIHSTSGRFTPLRPDVTSWNDVCIDEAGLILEDVNVQDGRIVGRRIAVEVEEEPSLSDDLFEIGEPSLPAGEGGGSVLEVSPSSRPAGTFWELGEPPSGFVLRGRYAVVPPQAGFQDPLARRSIVAGATDVWTDGRDVIVVEQGATLEAADPFGDVPGAQRVELGDLGEGEVLLAWRAPEVRVALGGGRFVRLYGSVGPDVLISVARDLREVEGGELVYLDEPPGPRAR